MRKVSTALFWALACGAFFSVNAAWAVSKSEWVLLYEGKSTNAFAWDKRTDSLIKTSVPSTLARTVLNALGGPPDPVFVVDRRYVSVSACVHHACMDKGFFWIDSQTGNAVGAHLSDNSLLLGSNKVLPGELPPHALQAINAWLRENDVQPRTVQFVSRNGKVNSLVPALFSRHPKYRPKPEGPSFDCKKATTVVEATICGDALLAKQDLDIATLVNQIRQGHSKVGAQDELRSMQREWLKGRDAACKNSLAMAECLGEQYRTQYDRLRHWMPR